MNCHSGLAESNTAKVKQLTGGLQHATMQFKHKDA